LTERPAKAPKTAPSVTRTQSKDILATFDPKTSELARLEQNTNFQYEEGDRRARGDKATLDQSKDLMTLDGSARILDPTGSVNADRIVMNQKTGDYTADGHVSSTRQPDLKGASSAMLSNDEVMQAVADKMISTGENKHIRYEGNARAWQGANRVDADRIEIDRERRVMEAHGKVVSQFADKSQDKTEDKKQDKKTGQRSGEKFQNQSPRRAYFHRGSRLRSGLHRGNASRGLSGWRGSRASVPYCEFAGAASFPETRRLGFLPR